MNDQDVNACEACRQLEARIADRRAKVCVIGLGYVGLPLATGLAPPAIKWSAWMLMRARWSC